MKKFNRFLACLMLVCIAFTLFSCSSQPDQTESNQTEAPTEKPTEITDNNLEMTECEHNYEKEGIMKYTCEKCGHEKTEIPKSVKILAIGNSFSDDATEHLWHIFNDAGVEEIILGNLFIGGCSLNTHYSNAQNDATAYEYRRNTDGVWNTTYNFKMGDALADEDWDIVTLQQASHDSGMPQTYGNLDKLIEYVEDIVSEDCRLYWHMTWAYQQNSDHSGFVNYSRDQLVMYDAIVGTVLDIPMKHKSISGVLPSGTAVQNLRTSYIGDTLTRDGYHLSFGLGRYVAALTWFAALGGDVDSITWCPQFELTYDLPAIKEAVKNAVNEPFDFTQSTFTEAPDRPENPTLEEIFEAIGKDINAYKELDLEETYHAYYNSTDTGYCSSLITTAGNSPQFNATAIFDKEQLPEGSLIIIESGYQYRPEGWKSLSTAIAGSSRPANVTNTVVSVNSGWWGSWNFRAFNISHTSGRMLDESDMGKLHIFVPVD